MELWIICLLPLLSPCLSLTPAPPLLPAYTPYRPYVTPTPYPAYGYSPSSGYSPAKHYAPMYRAPPRPKHDLDYPHPPTCSANTTKPWCLTDYEYPTHDIQHAIEYHYSAVAALYKDVIANTDNSVDRLKHPAEETYLCPTDTKYVMPLRAVNTEGKWRVIVNQVKAHYETLSQTVRIEECTTHGSPCPLIPECYETKCLQKSVYHRFLVFDPKDYYFPFAIESFKLPAACSCKADSYKFVQHSYNS